MAHSEHLARLKEGVDEWNQWRRANPKVRPDLCGADLSYAKLNKAKLSNAELSNAVLRYVVLSDAKLNGAKLSDAKLNKAKLSNAILSEADLSEADLSGADLNGADLSGADLYSAILCSAILCKADLSGAILCKADLSRTVLRRANLSNAELSDAILIVANLSNAILSNAVLSNAVLCKADLSNAILSNAVLCKADLRRANLSNAVLCKASLNHANLSTTQVLNTSFQDATLTGACIADWQIGSSTSFEGVKCGYIFRSYDTIENKFTDRLPVHPDATFAPGEFEQWIAVRKGALDTIDITFTEGIDWQAFFQSLQTTRQQHPEANVIMKAVEEEGGIFVARLKLETEVTGETLEKLKASVENEVKTSYALQLAKAQGKIEALESSLDRSERSLDKAVEKLAMTSSQNFYGTVGNVAGNNYGNMQAIQHIYAPEQQDLSEAAQEIQKLLNTLAEGYNTTSPVGQEKLLKELGQEVEKHPKWRRALKEGGIELIKVLCAPIGIPLEMARVYLEEEE